MSELEEKLNTLLSDPDAMAQVMDLAQNLQRQMDGGPAAPNGAQPPPEQRSEGNDLSATLSKTIAGLDPALLRRLLPVAAQLSRPQSSQTAALLYALRPFLRPSRQEKVERAVQLARVIHLAKEFLIAREG